MLRLTKNSFKLALALAFNLAAILLLPNAASADQEPKIGFINTTRIFKEAAVAISAGKRLESEFSARNNELMQLSKLLGEKKAFLDEKGLTLSESQRKSKESELSELTLQFRHKQQAFQEDLNQRQSQENSALIEKLNAATKSVAAAEHFDLIIQDAVYVSKSIDITDRILNALAN